MRTKSSQRLPMLVLVVALVLSPAMSQWDVMATSWSSSVQVPLPTTTNLRPSATVDSFSNIWLVYESAGGVNPESYYVIQSLGVWTSPVRLTNDPTANTSPSVVDLSNGTLFFAWVSNRTGSDQIWYRTNTNNIGSTELQLTSNTNPNEAPSVSQDLNGNIWVFWQRVVGSNSRLYYRVYSPGRGWGSEILLTTESNPVDVAPSTTVTNDGKVWVVWSSFRTGNYQTFAKTYNGTVWTADTQLTFFSGDDSSPAIVQTRDGAIWLAWSRTPTQSFGSNIYYKNSTNLGATWSSDTAVTNSANLDNFDPSLVQAPDHNLYLFWASDMPTGLDYNIFYETFGPIPLQPFDFSVSNSGGITLSPGTPLSGASGSNTIVVGVVGGPTQPVTLSVSGLPTGASASFSGSCTGFPSCTASPPFSSVLMISTTPSPPTGSYTITVTGSGGGRTHTTQFSLNVSPSGAVGGVVVPVDKGTLLAPFIGMASLIATVGVATFHLRRTKNRQEKKNVQE